MTFNYDKLKEARASAYAAYKASNTLGVAGKIAGYSILFAGSVAVGYAIGTAVLYILVALFGAKLGVILYLILYGASMAWLFMFCFQKDKYGFRA